MNVTVCDVSESDKQEKRTKYIFVRLYNAIYKNNIALSVLKRAILMMKEAKDGYKYTHAAISTMLDDSFVGLTAGGKLAAKIEKCHNNDPEVCPHMSEYDEHYSRYSVFALPVTEEEYRTVENVLKKALTDPNLSYSINALLAFELFGDKNTTDLSDELSATKIASAVNISPDKKAGKILKLLDKEQVVCSSFVAMVIAKCVKSVNKFIKHANAKAKYMTPSAITYIPDLECIISYKPFELYDNYAKDFVSNHPEFKKYLKAYN